MIRNEEIERLKGLHQPLLDAEARARALQSSIPNAHWYFGLSGIDFAGEPYDIFPGLMVLRQVTNPPGVVHVCRAANLKQSDYLGIARYSHTIKAEIVAGIVAPDLEFDADFLHGLAWHSAAMLKLRGHDTLFCPGSTTVSWDTVSLVDDQSKPFIVQDDVPQQIRSNPCRAITSDDLLWVRRNWEQALRLRDASSSQRFSLGFNISYTWNHTKDPRLAIAKIWSGMEALFGVQTDRPVTQRLVQRIAAWVPGTSEEDVRALYSHRCDAVHGRLMLQDQLADIITQSSGLLRSSLILSIERGQKTLPDWDT